MFTDRAEIAREFDDGGDVAVAGTIQTQPFRPQRQGRLALARKPPPASVMTAPSTCRAPSAPSVPVEHVAAADEARDERGGGPLVEVFLGAGLLHLAVAHDDEAIGHGHCLVLVVGDHHGRQPRRALQQADVAAHIGAKGGVEVGERFVE